MLLLYKIVEPSNDCQGVFYTQKWANFHLTQKTLKTAAIVSVHTGGVNT